LKKAKRKRNKPNFLPAPPPPGNNLGGAHITSGELYSNDDAQKISVTIYTRQE
jgi:hypothetical protein